MGPVRERGGGMKTKTTVFFLVAAAILSVYAHEPPAYLMIELLPLSQKERFLDLVNMDEETDARTAVDPNI